MGSETGGELAANVSSNPLDLNVPAGDAEIVVFVRDPKQPGYQRILVIHKPSRKFLNYLDESSSSSPPATAVTNNKQMSTLMPTSYSR